MYCQLEALHHGLYPSLVQRLKAGPNPFEEKEKDPVESEQKGGEMEDKLLAAPPRTLDLAH